MRTSSGVDASILREATRLRRELHQRPEIANQERETSKRMREFLDAYGVQPWRQGLGGHGLLFRLRGDETGPNVLLRADLDALPIEEQGRVAYRSKNPGTHHACGHDGHMAMLGAAIAQLADRRDLPGTVYALFQPAEETGEGAARVIADLPSNLTFHESYAIHNFPGLPVGTLGLRTGTAAKPSMGLEIELVGRRTHASTPENGRNPIPTLARLATDIQREPSPAPRRRSSFATIVGVDSGPANYGVSPGTSRLALTLRGATQAQLDRLYARVLGSARRRAQADGMRVRTRELDVFRETRNHPRAVAHARTAARRAGLSVVTMPEPLPASEDFGRFTETSAGALLLLGAGRTHAALHSADYDFPDALIEHGAKVWLSLADSAVPRERRDRAAKKTARVRRRG